MRKKKRNYYFSKFNFFQGQLFISIYRDNQSEHLSFELFFKSKNLLFHFSISWRIATLRKYFSLSNVIWKEFITPRIQGMLLFKSNFNAALSSAPETCNASLITSQKLMCVEKKFAYHYQPYFYLSCNCLVIKHIDLAFYWRNNSRYMLTKHEKSLLITSRRRVMFKLCKRFPNFPRCLVRLLLSQYKLKFSMG